MLRTLLPALLTASVLFVPGPARAQTQPVVFRSHHKAEELHFFGVGPRGDLNPPELDLLGKLMRCWRTGGIHSIHPRLARHLVGISRHFHSPVVVVSGYRAVSRSGRRRSYHLQGMAADIYVDGVPSIEVRDLAVASRIEGIGFYPSSGFIHLDVRPRRFWWVDYSRPGHSDRLVPDPEGDAPAEPEPSKVLSEQVVAPPEAEEHLDG
jgi:uncharacterized protein YcbK (DUF882 family)